MAIMNERSIENIAQEIYNRCFGENNDWWDKYCPFSKNRVKKTGSKFFKELNALGIETYENIRCEQTDWYFQITTSEDLYSIHLDWWNGYIEVNVTGFSGGFTVNSNGIT